MINYKIKRVLSLTLKESGVAFLLIIIGSILMGINSFLSAKMTDIISFGEYIAVTSLIMYLSVYISVGNGIAVVKAIIQTIETNIRTRNYYYWLIKWLTTSIFISITVGLITIYYGMNINDPSKNTSIIFILLVIFIPLTLISSAILRAYRYTFYSLLPTQIIRHLIFSTLLIFSYFEDKKISLFDLLLFELLGIFVALSFSCVLLSKTLLKSYKKKQESDYFNQNSWWWTSYLQVFTALTQQAVGLLDVILITILYNPIAAGLYGLASRFTKLVVLGNKAVNELAASQIATAFIKKDNKLLSLHLKNATRKALVISIPITIIIFIASLFLSSFLGKSYQGIESIILILLLGQFINSVTGPVGIAMSVTEMQKENLSLNTLALTFLIMGILIANHLSSSITYAVIISAFTIAFINIIKVIVFHRKYSIWITPI